MCWLAESAATSKTHNFAQTEGPFQPIRSQRRFQKHTQGQPYLNTTPLFAAFIFHSFNSRSVCHHTPPSPPPLSSLPTSLIPRYSYRWPDSPQNSLWSLAFVLHWHWPRLPTSTIGPRLSATKDTATLEYSAQPTSSRKSLKDKKSLEVTIETYSPQLCSLYQWQCQRTNIATSSLLRSSCTNGL